MYALIVVTGLLGWGLNAIFARAERRVLHWHPSQREVADEVARSSPPRWRSPCRCALLLLWGVAVEPAATPTTSRR